MSLRALVPGRFATVFRVIAASSAATAFFVALHLPAAALILFDVTVVAPTAGTEVSGSVTLSGRVTSPASSGSFTVSRVSAFGDPIVVPAINQDTDPLAWAANWDSAAVTNGGYTVVFNATNLEDGRSSASLPVAFTVNNAAAAPPAFTVTMREPAVAATLAGTVTLNAVTSGEAGSLSFTITSAGDAFAAATVSATGSADGMSWTASWDSSDMPNGAYIITANAFHGGTLSMSDPLPVTVQNAAAAPPLSVSLTAPAPDAVISGATSFSASTNLDADTVTFTVRDAANAVVDTLPGVGIDGRTWTAGWASAAVPDGAYTVRASAMKNGSTAQTDPRAFTTVNVVVPPPAPMTVTLIAPAGGATVSGAAALSALTSESADSLSFTITQSFGGRQVTVVPATGVGTAWNATWNAAAMQNGSYTVVATATKDGTETSSAVSSVTLSNAVAGAPPALAVTVTSPTAGVTLSGTTTLVATTNVAANSLVFILRDAAAPEAAPVATVSASAGAGSSMWTATINTATVPNGSYALIARGTKDGVVVPSSPVTVSVQNADPDAGATPVNFTVTLPTPGAQLSGTVALSATADQPIDGFTFSIDGASGSADLSLPATGNDVRTVWNAIWDTSSVPNGDYTLTTVATKSGSETPGAPRAFRVANTTVSVTITTPSNNAEVSGSHDVIVAAVPAATSVTVSITSATNGAMTSLRNATFDTGRQVWITPWNTVDFPNGDYRLEARGLGSMGREFLSAAVNVKVMNAARPAAQFGVRLIAPGSGATVTGNVALAAAVSGEAAAVQFFATPTSGAVIRVDGHYDAARGLWVGTWRSAESASGPASIGAVAVNAQNVRVESARTQITVVNAARPPAPAAATFSVHLLEPADGGVSGKVRFAAQTEGSATLVRFFVRRRGATGAPRELRAAFDAGRAVWIAEWDTATEEIGTYEAVAVARNAAGEETTSPNVATLFIERRAAEPVEVPASGEPSAEPETGEQAARIVITQPSAAVTVRGVVVIKAVSTLAARVSFSARASSGVATMTRAGILTDGAWSTLWDTSALIDGRYVIDAVAFSKVGERIATAQTGVTVANSGERTIDAVDIVPTEVLKDVIREVPAGTVALPVELLSPGVAEAAPKLEAECAENRMPAVRCQEWLASRHQDAECRSAGIITKQECVSYLKKVHGGEIPDCKGRSDEVCGEVIARSTAGLLDASELRDIRDAITPKIGQTLNVPKRPEGTEAAPAAGENELPVAVADHFPLVSDGDVSVLVHASPSYAESGENFSHQTVPAVLFFDTDGDGLPDDVEKRFGTDPAKWDTDADGYSDKLEISGGYNPRGKGRLSDGVTSIAPVDIAIISGSPIEQPTTAGIVNDELAVDVPVATEDAAGGRTLKLSGRAKPGEVVTVFVYSYLPVVFTTTAEEDGTWSYELDSGLADGQHEVYATVTDETGKIKEKSGPLSFFVSEAKAVGEDQFFEPEDVSPLAAAQVQEPLRRFGAWYLGGAALLIGLALIVAYLLFMRPKAPPPEG